MAALAGKRYITPSGAELIVTKGGPGDLSDGEVALQLKDASSPMADQSGRTEPMLLLGQRYSSEDGRVELLVIKAGACDLRYDGEPMTQLAAKILPSAD